MTPWHIVFSCKRDILEIWASGLRTVCSWAKDISVCAIFCYLYKKLIDKGNLRIVTGKHMWSGIFKSASRKNYLCTVYFNKRVYYTVYFVSKPHHMRMCKAKLCRSDNNDTLKGIHRVHTQFYWNSEKELSTVVSVCSWQQINQITAEAE